MQIGRIGCCAVLVVSASALFLGCAWWSERQAYDAPRSWQPYPWCNAELADISIGTVRHVLLRDCSISILPPLYWCTPVFGFASEIGARSKVDRPVTVVIESYRLRVLGEARLVEPRVPARRGGQPVATLQIHEPFGRAQAVPVQFCVENGLEDVTVELAGRVTDGHKSEDFQCSLKLDYREARFQWSGPFGVVE